MKFPTVLKESMKCCSVPYIMTAVELTAQQQFISGDTIKVNLLNLCSKLISTTSTVLENPPQKGVSHSIAVIAGRRTVVMNLYEQIYIEDFHWKYIVNSSSLFCTFKIFYKQINPL